MMKPIRSLLVVVFLTLGFGCDAPPPEDGLAGKIGEFMNNAPSPPRLDRVAPDHVTTLFENQHVLVMRLSLPIGGRIPKHTADTRAVYALYEGDLNVTNDREPTIESYSAGEADIWAAGRYALENPGPTDVDLLVVSRSEIDLPEASDHTEETSAAKPSRSDVALLASNEQFTVEEVLVPARDEQRLERDRPFVVYTLTPSEVGIERAGGVVFNMQTAENQAIWFDADSRPVLIASDDPLRVVIFEFNL